MAKSVESWEYIIEHKADYPFEKYLQAQKQMMRILAKEEPSQYKGQKVDVELLKEYHRKAVANAVPKDEVKEPENKPWLHQNESELIERAREGSLAPISTIHWDDETKKLLKKLVKQGKIEKFQNPMWSGPGNRYSYVLPFEQRMQEYKESQESNKSAEKMDKGELITEMMKFVPKASDLYSSTKKSLGTLHTYELRDSLIELQKGKPDTSLQSIQAIHESRSPLSQSSDERQSNADTIDMDDPRVGIWKRDPGRLDVEGIDTPKSKKKGSKQKSGKRRSSRPPTSLGRLR